MQTRSTQPAHAEPPSSGEGSTEIRGLGDRTSAMEAGDDEMGAGRRKILDLQMGANAVEPAMPPDAVPEFDPSLSQSVRAFWPP